MMIRLVVLLCCFCFCANGQVKKYDQFELKEGDVVWKNSYSHYANRDSLRAAVVQMLKSKFYTFNVIRNEIGYNGELRHYKIDCKGYGRNYLNTPRMYWEGEWTGKFIVEIKENEYVVTVYALYYESPKPSADYYRTEKQVKGRYLDAVTKKDRSFFLKRELSNLSLMNLSLKDAFKLSSTSYINN